MSLETGIFPTRLKQSIVKPLFKKGNRTNMCNYRPITLIPIIAKIFEKVMCDRIGSFLNKNNILTDNQFGFRKSSSTSLACFSLVKLITEALNDKMSVLSVFLDMSKAFDFVPHARLLCKMEKYGIRGKAHDLLKSYLSCRQQRTVVYNIANNTKTVYISESKINGCGVPQGSVLGPLLFILYINDLCNNLKHNCTLFADDTTLTIKCLNRNDLETETNNELLNAIKWLESNNLHVNIEKTKLVQFQTYNNLVNPPKIQYNNLVLEPVPSTLFLGIVFDEKLNWKEHVKKVCNKLDKFVFALRKLRLIAGKETALITYHGYVSSVLRYGLVIWGNSVDVNRAFIAQKKCIRAVYGAEYLEHCKPLFKELNILPLPCLYILEICLFIKRYNHLFPLHEHISKRVNSRSPKKLHIPNQRLHLYSRNSNCMAIKIFNNLPPFIRVLPINKFRKTIFGWLLDKCFYSVNEFLNHDT